MKILLDTHIFLWFISGDRQLSSGVREVIRDSNNEVYLSVVSVWEPMIKYQLGKLPLPESPEAYLPRQRDRHQIASLTLNNAALLNLLSYHPCIAIHFDRILICQALQNGLTISTVDTAVRAYSISTI